MIYEPQFLDFLQEQESGKWEGKVFRHMFADYPPQRENTGGARWNPSGVAAIYTSLKRATALAEADHKISLQPVRPRVRRTIYQIHVHLDKALRLPQNALDHLGATAEVIAAIDLGPCQMIGGAVAWLEYDGMIVPSARHKGSNLVIFPMNQIVGYALEVVDEEVIDEGRT